jgi:hypothetical protein
MSHRNLGWFFLFFWTLPLWAAAPPDGYIEMTAVQKRDWHATRAVETDHIDNLPSLPKVVCKQTLAALGFLYKWYMEETLREPSGFPIDTWRRLFGKAIHSRGVTAPGSIEIRENELGLKPGNYPVTYRFSLANPYVLGVPFSQFRPGLLVIFHRDGEKDLNLFLMPSRGLRGYRLPINPFSVPYTNWLEKPGLVLRTIAAFTFGRVALDPYTQLTDSNLETNFSPDDPETPSRETSARMIFDPESSWIPRYRSTGAFNFMKRFSRMVFPKGEKLFEISSEKEGGPRQAVGSAHIEGPWIASKHGDTWIAEHMGFVLN